MMFVQILSTTVTTQLITFLVNNSASIAAFLTVSYCRKNLQELADLKYSIKVTKTLKKTLKLLTFFFASF